MKNPIAESAKKIGQLFARVCVDTRKFNESMEKASAVFGTDTLAPPSHPNCRSMIMPSGLTSALTTTDFIGQRRVPQTNQIVDLSWGGGTYEVKRHFLGEVYRVNAKPLPNGGVDLTISIKHEPTVGFDEDETPEPEKKGGIRESSLYHRLARRQRDNMKKGELI